MNFSEVDLRSYLQKQLVGKNFGYCWDMDVAQAFKTFITEQGLNERDFSVSRCGVNRYRPSNQTAYIIYKGNQEVGYIEAKKQKGERHYFYGHYYNDWTFKDLGVVFYAKDFATAVDQAKQRIVAKEDAETKMKNDAAELLKVAQEKFGSNARSIIEYLNKHYWTIEDLIKKEEK